jgi:hypothetical protein
MTLIHLGGRVTAQSSLYIRRWTILDLLGIAHLWSCRTALEEKDSHE